MIKLKSVICVVRINIFLKIFAENCNKIIITQINGKIRNVKRYHKENYYFILIDA